MRKTTLSLVVALLCGTAAVEAFAQQGSGPGARLSSSNRANVGAGNRPELARANSQGALRSIGRGKSGGGTSAGAQLSASGGANAGGLASNANANARGRAAVETRGLSFQARAREEMIARARRAEGRRADAGSRTAVDAERGSMVRGEAATRSPWERSDISRADWLLATRLASIDHMRDVALQNGNERMLDQANKLEALARVQHERRVGEFSEAAGSEERSSSVDVRTSTQATVEAETPAPMQ